MSRLVAALAVVVAIAGCVRVDDDGSASRAVVAAQLANPTIEAMPSVTPTTEAAPAATPTLEPTPTVAVTPTVVATATAAATPMVEDPYFLLFPRGVSEDDGADDEDEGQGNRNNIVNMVNRRDGRLRFKGRVQLNRITGSTVNPVNQAIAYASCTDCQTYAIALQLDVVGREVTTFTPQNVAIAVNYKCTCCHTIARAVQFVRQVDDPRDVPDEVRDQAKRLDRELKSIHAQSNRLSADEVDQQVDAVVARFQTMAQAKLEDTRDDEFRENSGAKRRPAA
jgi:hypothetical protein